MDYKVIRIFDIIDIHLNRWHRVYFVRVACSHVDGRYQLNSTMSSGQCCKLHIYEKEIAVLYEKVFVKLAQACIFSKPFYIFFKNFNQYLLLKK